MGNKTIAKNTENINLKFFVFAQSGGMAQSCGTCHAGKKPMALWEKHTSWGSHLDFNAACVSEARAHYEQYPNETDFTVRFSSICHIFSHLILV